MLHIKNFQKAYHGRTVLQVSDLQLGDGVHWLRGSNGSGKSTFFRCVAGMLPCEGEIWLDNQWEVQRNPVAFRLRVNYAEAEPLYPEYLSAFDLITFIAKAKKAPVGQMDRLVDAMEIREFWKQPVGTYSSGMLKKTSLIIGFLGSPKLIMLDEPLVTIDDRAVSNVCQLINQYHQDGVSFLLSSHQDFRLTDLALDSAYIIRDQTIKEAVS
ncbi:MAG: ATP-binding cassette domain-containing protein [Siphonobacter sp.]